MNLSGKTSLRAAFVHVSVVAVSAIVVTIAPRGV
jgi:hypothetical protein